MNQCPLLPGMGQLSVSQGSASFVTLTAEELAEEERKAKEITDNTFILTVVTDDLHTGDHKPPLALTEEEEKKIKDGDCDKTVYQSKDGTSELQVQLNPDNQADNVFLRGLVTHLNRLQIPFDAYGKELTSTRNTGLFLYSSPQAIHIYDTPTWDSTPRHIQITLVHAFGKEIEDMIKSFQPPHAIVYIILSPAVRIFSVVLTDQLRKSVCDPEIKMEPVLMGNLYNATTLTRTDVSDVVSSDHLLQYFQILCRSASFRAKAFEIADSYRKRVREEKPHQDVYGVITVIRENSLLKYCENESFAALHLCSPSFGRVKLRKALLKLMPDLWKDGNHNDPNRLIVYVAGEILTMYVTIRRDEADNINRTFKGTMKYLSPGSTHLKTMVHNLQIKA